MYWIYLMVAIVTEVAGTVSLKLSHGLTRTLPAAVTIVLYLCSFVALAASLKKIDVGMAYAVWSAVGTALIAAIGILWFKESASLLKLVSLALIVAGVFCLQVSAVR